MNFFLYFHIQTRSCSYYILLRTDSSFFTWSLKTLLNNLLELILGISGTISHGLPIKNIQKIYQLPLQKHLKNISILTSGGEVTNLEQRIEVGLYGSGEFLLQIFWF